MRIQALPPHVANQIAAGEVIERPASVVKELLENALDAEANTIHIEIGFGGLNQIKISDNGTGIVADDLLLAITSHATSKMKHLDDLYQIQSMGFRGEALASIASVSRLRLSSKPKNQTDAMVLEADERGVFQSPCARNQGTTVEVLDLFYNAPVRKKFLKSERLEFQAIETVVKRFALSAPHIALTLKHNGQIILSLSSAACKQSEGLRIKKILGKTFVEQSVAFHTEHETFQLYGFLSLPTYQRSQRDKQWIYLNRRMISDRLIQHAIAKAYQPLLYPGRFAACLLYLSMPAHEVDVNVHPTKHEVRFQSSKTIHDFIVSSVSDVLATHHPSHQDDVKENHGGSRQLREKAVAYTHHLGAVPMNVGTWYPINKLFALASVTQANVYLIHVERAYQFFCQDLMKNEPLPLASRPLLIPLQLSIHKQYHLLFEQLQAKLVEFGVQFDFVSETMLVIRTIPLCFPQLDLRLLFVNLEKMLHNAFRHFNGSRDQVIEAFMMSQSFSIESASTEDKARLLAFIEQQSFPARYCKLLDNETCLSVLSDE